MTDYMKEAERLTGDQIKVLLNEIETDKNKVIRMLIAVTRKAYRALDDSEEIEGDDGRAHVISGKSFDDLCDALDALDELPDDKPGCTMNPADKAEWALRALAVPMPEAVGLRFDGTSLHKEVDVRTYGDAREAAGYAQGRKEAGRDAERYRWFKKHHVIGAMLNGVVANRALLNGQRDKNRILVSCVLRGDAADKYSSPTAKNLDEAIDADLRGEVRP